MQRTVFLLGAGASQPYRFLTGRELRREVCSQLTSERAYAEVLRRYTKFKDPDIIAFCNELLTSAQVSVDAFLEYRPEFMKIGKAAMSAILVSCEQAPNLWVDEETNWMIYMFDRLNRPFTELKRLPISFVTFNYDRSLEHFLYRTIQSRYGKSEAECASVLDHIPIIHPHGRLGYLPWQEGKGKRSYEPAIGSDIIETCVENIKVVHEGIDTPRDKEFEQARDLLQKAESIYYLGFGYGSQNLERLKLRDIAPKRNYGTGKGLTQHEINSIVREVGTGERVNPQIDKDCIRILREYGEWN